MLLLAGRRQLRLAAFAAGATILGEVAVLAYTASLDWHTYRAEVRIRASQLSGLTGYRFITNTTGFDSQQAFDGWWLLGWLALAELIGRRRGDYDLLTVPAVVYLVVMLGTAAEYSSGYGWYRLTIMPIVYLAAGRFIWLAVSELSVLRLALVAAMALATAANWAASPHPLRSHPDGRGGRCAVLPALVAMVRPKPLGARPGAYALMALLVPVSLVEVATWARSTGTEGGGIPSPDGGGV